MAPSIWLRHVSTTGVFKEGWVALMIANCKDRQEKRVKGIFEDYLLFCFWVKKARSFSYSYRYKFL